MGLLDQWAGDTDLQSPQNQQMMSIAAALLQAGGPSRTPISFGQALGGAMQAGNQAYQGAQDRLTQADLRKQQKMMQDLQMKGLGLDIQSKQMAQDQAAAQKRAFMNYRGQQAAQQPTQQPQSEAMNEELANLGAAGAPMGNQPIQNQTQSPTQGQPQNQIQQAPVGKIGAIQARIDDLNNRANYMESSEGISGDDLRKQALELEKLKPKFATEPRVVMQNGRPVLVQIADDGTVQPIQGGYGVAEKLHFANTGGNTSGINAYTGETVSQVRNTQSPDSIASNATTMRGQNMTDARARDLNQITREGQQTQVINDPIRGPMLIDKGMGTAKIAVGANGQPIQGETAAKREYGANNLKSVLDDAKGLIGKATGSYIGAGVDKAAQAFGVATGGAESIAQLKILEGNIMMAQPRMEGPQSDKDVMLYRQMAGQIGDPTVPNAIKVKNLEMLEKLNNKYATGTNQPNTNQPTTSKPKSKILPLPGGGSAAAKLAPDGNYYIQQGDKKYRVDE